MRPLQKIKATTNLKKLNILHIATHTKVTRGGSVQLLRLIRGLKERGHNVFCALSAGKNGKPVQETLDLLTNEKIGCFFFNMHKLSSKILLRRIIKAIEFDVIHTHRDLALIFLLQSTLGMKCPAIIANRGTTYPLHFPSLKWFAHRSKRVNKIVAVSQAVKESLIKHAHIKPEKIEVIYGGVDIDEFDSIEVGLAKERFWIQELNSMVPSGYNLNGGGGGNFNPSRETRELLRISRLGKPVSEETRAKLRGRIPWSKGKPSPKKGIRLSEETRLKMSRATRKPAGPVSDETRAKMSLAKAGYVPWIKGKHHSEESKRKMSLAKRAK